MVWREPENENRRANLPPKNECHLVQENLLRYDLSMCNCATKKTHKTPHSHFVSFLSSMQNPFPPQEEEDEEEEEEKKEEEEEEEE